jgi:hypothetical protein
MPHKLLDEFFTSKIETYSQGFYINNFLLLIRFVKVQRGNNLLNQGMRQVKNIF